MTNDSILTRNFIEGTFAELNADASRAAELNQFINIANQYEARQAEEGSKIPKVERIELFDLLQSYMEEESLDESVPTQTPLDFLVKNMPLVFPVAEALADFGNYDGGISNTELMDLFEDTDVTLTEDGNYKVGASLIGSDVPQTDYSLLHLVDRLRDSFDARISDIVPEEVREYVNVVSELALENLGEDRPSKVNLGEVYHALLEVGIDVTATGRWHAERKLEITVAGEEGEEAKTVVYNGSGDLNAPAQELSAEEVSTVLSALRKRTPENRFGNVKNIGDLLYGLPLIAVDGSEEGVIVEAELVDENLPVYQRAVEFIEDEILQYAIRPSPRSKLVDLTSGSLADYCANSDRSKVLVQDGAWVNKRNGKLVDEDKALGRLADDLDSDYHDPRNRNLDRGTTIGNIAHAPYDIACAAGRAIAWTGKGLWDARKPLAITAVALVAVGYAANAVIDHKDSVDDLAANQATDYGALLIKGPVEDVVNDYINEFGSETAFYDGDRCVFNGSKTASGFVDLMTRNGTKLNPTQQESVVTAIEGMRNADGSLFHDGDLYCTPKKE